MTGQRREIMKRLAEHMHQLRHRDIKSLALFGSVARDAATPTSDVGLRVESIVPLAFWSSFGSSMTWRLFWGWIASI